LFTRPTYAIHGEALSETMFKQIGGTSQIHRSSHCKSRLSI
jgi:hypothetical protein